VTAWILFMVWENVYDTKERMLLRGNGHGRKSLKAPADAAQEAAQAVGRRQGGARDLPRLRLPARASRATTCPTWTRSPGGGDVLQPERPRRRGAHGGRQAGADREAQEGHHGAVGEAVRLHALSGVSDGVQSIVTEKHPDAIFLPIETTATAR
jgi:hypothetical protein